MSEFGSLFALERVRLLELLGSLGDEEWGRPTRCPGWSVLGLAQHLLGGDFALVSRARDDHHGTPAPPGLDEAGFIGWLDELQIDWVDAARRCSPRLTVELLTWIDGQVVATIDAQDPAAITARVSWASDGLVPVALDQARELTERWIHRQQLLEALDRPSDLRTDLAGPVLDALRWAYPHRLQDHPRAAGSVVTISVDDDALTRSWVLTSDGSRWAFDISDAAPIATMSTSAESFWRVLTNNLDPAHRDLIDLAGDPDIVDTLATTRAIIGAPK